MQTTIRAAALAACLAAAGSVAAAQNPMVGGAAMFPDRNIVENALNSADHTTLVAAVQAVGLVETLTGPGPFTVFAPTDAAFDRIDDAALARLMMPQHKAQLAQILACHVVPAAAMSDAIRGMIDDDGGVHAVSTVGGCTLQVRRSGDDILIADERGRRASVTIADVVQSNGVIHVIDRVLLPAS